MIRLRHHKANKMLAKEKNKTPQHGMSDIEYQNKVCAELNEGKFKKNDDKFERTIVTGTCSALEVFQLCSKKHFPVAQLHQPRKQFCLCGTAH